MSALASVMVTVQLKVPTLEGASTVTVILALLPALMAPDEEEMWHQVWLVEPVQFKVALPKALEMFKVCPAGAEPPETPEKVKEVGLKTIWGLGVGLLLDAWQVIKPVPLPQVQEVAPPWLGKAGEAGLEVMLLEQKVSLP